MDPAERTRLLSIPLTHSGELKMADMTADDVLKMLKDKEAKFVDLRFTDTRGKEQHVSVPTKYFTKDKFEVGHAFDGSSIAGWKGIQASDMLLMPDPRSARMDPFTDERCSTSRAMSSSLPTASRTTAARAASRSAPRHI
jgi:glutamine synthetase